jgi:hypothetical protein
VPCRKASPPQGAHRETSPNSVRLSLHVGRCGVRVLVCTAFSSSSNVLVGRTAAHLDHITQQTTMLLSPSLPPCLVCVYHVSIPLSGSAVRPRFTSTTPPPGTVTAAPAAAKNRVFICKIAQLRRSWEFCGFGTFTRRQKRFSGTANVGD